MGSRGSRADPPELKQEPDNKYRSRKWILSCVIQATAILGLGFGVIDGGSYAEICVANIVAYSFANAAEYFRKDTTDPNDSGSA